MNTPTRMRAAMLHDVDDLRIVEMPVPKLEPGDLLVRIAASGICSGDLMPWYIRRKAPLVLGHEPAGVVVAVGEGAPAADPHGRAFEPGDHVAIHHHAPCLQCRMCERGDYVQCATWKATRVDPGGIAEYVRVPAANLVDTQHISPSVAFEDAVLVEPLGCVIKSLRRGRLTPDDIVYVVGLGVMGLLHVVLARELGCETYGSDFRQDRRANATALGAVATFAPAESLEALRAATDGRGADLVICGPGNQTALQHAIEATAPGGRVGMFTPLEPGQHFSFDQSAAYFRDVSLISSYSCGPNDTAESLAAITRLGLRAENLGAKTVALVDTADASRSRVAGEVIKSIICF
jgi:L-iditol 2-dehydrogenase